MVVLGLGGVCVLEDKELDSGHLMCWIYDGSEAARHGILYNRVPWARRLYLLNSKIAGRG